MTKISDGNIKLGDIPNVSMAPVRACGNCAACARTCYALKAYRMYKNTRAAWDHNLNAARTSQKAYFSDISAYIYDKKPRFFRWHVAGDILNQSYLNNMYALARTYPRTKFLAFTKMFKLKYKKRPKNLTIVFSIYPSMNLPRKKWPRAWMQDGSEKRIPYNAIECGGDCEFCGKCWDLAKLKRDVYFHKH